MLMVVCLIAILAAFILSRYAPVVIKKGMTRAQVETLLHRVGAEDLSDQLSTYTVVIPGITVDSTTNRTGMWHLSSIDLTLETVFVDEKLEELYVWDWSGRKLDRYHHLLEYESTTELVIPLLHRSFRYKIVETHNRGVNPPARPTR